ncbi:phage major tail protein [Paenibacillus alvei DSM 29]|nr:major tail protein [Paenibacillus alvei]EJW14155.1 phage major tail protein [Paenibacillus alvei DSM 29]
MSTKTAAVGLKNMHYAKLIKDDETGVEYSTPKRLAPAITANITPTVNSATLFADDGPLLTANALGEITVEIGITDLPFDIQADLLGLKKTLMVSSLIMPMTKHQRWRLVSKERPLQVLCVTFGF